VKVGRGRGTSRKRPNVPPWTRRVASSVCLALLALGLTRQARAAEVAGASLVVEHSPAANDCPDAAQLASAVLKLGSPPASAREPLAIAVYFEARPDGYVARIEATGREQGERVLETPGTSCEALAQATAVALAILIDLLPAREAPPAAAPPKATAAPACAPSGPAPPPPALRPSFHLGLGLDWALAYGLLGSNFSAATDLALRGSYGSVGFELSGLTSTPHYELVAPGLIRLNLFAGQALGCFWLGEAERRAIGACAGLGLGSLTGHARGYDTDDSAARLWTAAIASLNARFPVSGRWGCVVALSALVPLRSQAFLVEPEGRGFHSAPAALALRFGSELRFW
jgi:hypothetical protein